MALAFAFLERLLSSRVGPRIREDFIQSFNKSASSPSCLFERARAVHKNRQYPWLLELASKVGAKKDRLRDRVQGKPSMLQVKD